MKLFKYIWIIIAIVSCTNDDNISENDNLSTYILNRTIETGAVIACAASDITSDDVLVFYYPEPNATNIRLYETTNTDVDHNEFSNYTMVNIEPLPFFNGYLGKIIRPISIEKWVIVTFELEGEIKISNPIRTKQITKPSVWTDQVRINQDTSTMPSFTWQNNAFGDNAIYFQIISDAQNNLLSGTYTLENQFQYYNISNVVLNITRNVPPILSIGETHNFTLMDVSLDNWVNLVIQKPFEIQ